MSLAVLVPSLFVLVFGTLNVAWYLHGRDIVLSAAREGVSHGRVRGAPEDTAARTASDFARTTGDGILSDVTVDRSGSNTTEVCVRVQAHVALFVPFLPSSKVSQKSCSPIERFTP